MARPQSSTSKLILSFPGTMTATDVVKAAKAKGLKTTESNVYRVRRLAKKTARKATAGASAPKRGPGRPPKASAAPSGRTEDLLRAVAAEVGLSRAIEVLQGEREHIRKVLAR